MLKITRLKDGKTYSTPAEWLALVESKVGRIYQPGVVALRRTEVQYEDSMIYSCKVQFEGGSFTLDPALYSVTDSDSIPRSEVERVFAEEKQSLIDRKVDKTDAAELGRAVGAKETWESLRRTLSLNLTEKQ